MTEIAAFSDHERKLFRRRLILSPVIAITIVVAACPYLLGTRGVWYVLTAAACVVLFIAVPGLIATERETDLKRFDAILNDSQRRAISRLRGVRALIRNYLWLLCLLVNIWEPAMTSRPIVLTFVVSQFVAAWLFRRETAIVRNVAQLTP